MLYINNYSVHSSLIPGQFEHILHAKQVGILQLKIISSTHIFHCHSWPHHLPHCLRSLVTHYGLGRQPGQLVGTLDLESEISGSIPALTPIWNCNTVIPSSNSLPTFVNCQLVSLPRDRIVNVMLCLQYLFL